MNTLEKIKQTLDELGWNKTDLRAVIPELSQSAVWNVLAGSRPMTPKTESVFKEFLAAVERGEHGAGAGGKVVSIGKQPKRPARQAARARQVYATEMRTQVFSLIDYAAERARIGVGLAGFGAGKTHAARQWIAANPEIDSLLFEFSEFTRSNRLEFISELAAGLGLSFGRVSSSSSATVFRAVIEELRSRPKVLIFDQCERVRIEVLQIIRQVWDHASDSGTAVVLLAAPELKVRLQRGRSSDLGALTSRVGVWADLSGLLREEMPTILQAEGLWPVADDALLLWHQVVRGSMRYFIESIDLIASRHKGNPITTRTIAGVAKQLMGLHVAPVQAGARKTRTAAAESA